MTSFFSYLGLITLLVRFGQKTTYLFIKKPLNAKLSTFDLINLHTLIAKLSTKVIHL